MVASFRKKLMGWRETAVVFAALTSGNWPPLSHFARGNDRASRRLPLGRSFSEPCGVNCPSHTLPEAMITVCLSSLPPHSLSLCLCLYILLGGGLSPLLSIPSAAMFLPRSALSVIKRSLGGCVC
uniref:Secreted protein n=1 Tax=Globodera rostochiensis TaxID=31243 RepID=A0A914I6C9_GLORO